GERAGGGGVVAAGGRRAVRRGVLHGHGLGAGGGKAHGKGRGGRAAVPLGHADVVDGQLGDAHQGADVQAAARDGDPVQRGGGLGRGQDGVLDLQGRGPRVGGGVQGDGPGHVGRGHRRAAVRAVGVARQRRVDAGARGAEVYGGVAVVGEGGPGAAAGDGGDGDDAV